MLLSTLMTAITIRQPGRPSHVRMCGDITDIASFMLQVRAAKRALVRGLEEEDGEVSEDMAAVIAGLGSVNPTAPNPADDSDLWSGVKRPDMHIAMETAADHAACVFRRF